MSSSSEGRKYRVFVFIAHILGWTVWGLGAALTLVLLSAGAFANAAIALATYLLLGYWIRKLAEDFAEGRVLLPHGHIYWADRRRPSGFSSASTGF